MRIGADPVVVGYDWLPGRAGGRVFRHLTVMMTAASLLACSAPDAGLGPRDNGDTGSSGATQEDDTAGVDTGSATDSDAGSPVWFNLGALVTLEETLATAVSLELSFYDGDLSLLHCTETWGVTGVVAESETPDSSIYHWWRLSLAPPESDCTSSEQLADSIHLGLGALHPEVEAQLLSQGMDLVSDSLYGAYVLLDPGQQDLAAAEQVALAYGYGGTLGDRAGASEAQQQGPLRDGDYEISGVFLFPVDGEDD